MNFKYYILLLLLNLNARLARAALLVGSTANSQNGFIQAWDTDQFINIPLNFVTNGHTQQVRALKLINETTLASGSDDNSIKIWDLTSQECLNTIIVDNPPTFVLALEVLINGNIVAGLENGKISIWDPNTGVLVQSLIDHTARVNTLELLSNGDLASGSDDHKIDVWDLISYNLKYQIDAGACVNSLRELNDGNLASAQSDGNINVWLLDNSVISASVNFNILSIGSGSLALSLTGHTAKVNDLELMENGDLVSCSDDLVIKVWDISKYVLRFELVGHSAPINKIKMLNNDELASGSSDMLIKIWNMTNQTFVTDFVNVGNSLVLEYVEKPIVSPSSIGSTGLSSSTSTTSLMLSIISSSPISTSISLSSTLSSTLTSTTSTSSVPTNNSSATTQTITSPILILNQTFNFGELNSSQAVDLLKLNYDLNGCIVNCSNKGACKFDSASNKFYCLCSYDYISGPACEKDKRPCNSNPCLNNATCVDYTNRLNYNISIAANTSYYCVCNKQYEGGFCEYKVDVCKNESCSGNGNCVDMNNEPKCQCFSMFEGEKCEFQSNELKTVKTVKKYSAILAGVVVVVFYLTILFMDFTKYCLKCKKKIVRKKNRKIKANKF